MSILILIIDPEWQSTLSFEVNLKLETVQEFCSLGPLTESTLTDIEKAEMFRECKKVLGEI